MPNYDEEERDLSWEKPSWAKNGPALRATGRADQMKGGDLASPITNLPHQKEDGPFEKPEWTGTVSQKVHPSQDLAKPITSLPHGGAGSSLAFEKPSWTKESNVKITKKGEAMKSGKEIARPIGGIKPVES
ncbi:predicted protein [Phaeodactylum tricornutum CCAP 1055/1]|jgi:hypothetical protein|uniref:Uncharacterized protein n=2 Tax=Phaeodactylum tricornutum TaxID=2850 RepID=B7G8N6_PHATC|nr:predicted protein [Phaeodactylum tricornutum CCAP 1055/1]EEC45073.1 predicted protein [Phaeodactylum tricornutum CCAP 1055/1]|eukprot:XP_002183373.1 predicted protein [Phaeodactylum tricornutum CCAP 1055/1]